MKPYRMTLGSLRDALASFSIRDTITEVLQETAEDLAELNRGQLFLGKKSDGGYLPDYSRVSVEKYGKPAGPMRLYDTGAFWRGIKVTARSDGFKFGDNDSKYADLSKRFGKDILGLSQESKNEEYIPLYFRPLLFSKIHAKLGI